MDNTYDNELATYPPDLLRDAKIHAGFGERDLQSLTTDEKVRHRPLLPLPLRHRVSEFCHAAKYNSACGAAQTEFTK